jgi:hypothetical protein
MNKKLLSVLVAVVILLFIILGGFWYYKNKIFSPTQNQINKDITSTVPIETATTSLNVLGLTASEAEESNANSLKQCGVGNGKLGIPPINGDGCIYTSKDASVQGVGMALDGQYKYVYNRQQGYSILVPSSLVLGTPISTTNSDFLEFYDPVIGCEFLYCPPQVSINIRDDKGVSLDATVKNEENEFPVQPIQEDKIIIDGINGYKLYYPAVGSEVTGRSEIASGSYPTISYYFINGGKLYEFVTPTDPIYTNFINSLKFLP